MSVLGKHEILASLQRNLEDRLFITPLLDPSQIGESSVDLRLGNDFIVTRRGNLSCIDPSVKDVKEHRYQTKHFVNFKEPFYLHPQELVLAGTLEYFKLPTNICAYVTSRSSWGRAGLIIATATTVHPGFTGTITLELVNLGEVPLVLYPGLSVAQIVFLECKGGAEYNGRFSGYTEAQYASISKDNKKLDLKFWTES